MQLTMANPDAAVSLATAGFVHANLAGGRPRFSGAGPGPAAAAAPSRIAETADEQKLRETFAQFVGEVFFGQLLKAMRKTVGEPAYFYGGRAEEVFRGQLDQVLAEKLARQSGAQLAGPMYELFGLSRR